MWYYPQVLSRHSCLYDPHACPHIASDVIPPGRPRIAPRSRHTGLYPLSSNLDPRTPTNIYNITHVQTADKSKAK